MTRSMASLTVEASRTLSQIARDALDEEQYDMMVDSLDQLVTLGFHPPPDLIRALFAVVLCDPSDVESSTGGRGKRKKQRRYLGLQYSEQSGPDSATISDATSVLEKLGSVAGPSVVLDALPPKCAGIEDEEKRLREAYQTLSGRRASTSPAAKRRRKSGRGIRHMDDGSDEDDDDSSRGSDSDTGASSEFARRVGQMVQSQQIWDVLLYDPFHVNEAPPKKAISHREADDDENGGPQDASVVSTNADRESVWSALSTLERLWDRQRLHSPDAAALNLSSQVCPPEETDKGRHAKRRKREDSPGPSPQLSKALEIVRIGLTTHVASKASDVDWQTILRQRSEHKKGQVAARLLAQLFDLAERDLFPSGSLVKGTTHVIYLKTDCLGMQTISRAVMPRINDTWNLALSALYFLCESGLEKNDDYDDDPPEEYTSDCEAALKDKTVHPSVHRIVDDLEQDAGWLVAGPDFGVLEHEDLLSTIPSNVKRQAGELLMTGAWQVSSQSDNIAVESITTRAGKAKTKRDKDEAAQARLDAQALALALRIKADEINMICSRSFARIEVIRLLLQSPDGESPTASVAAFAKTCIGAVECAVRADKRGLQQCIESMSREVTRVEGDIDLFVKGNEGTCPSPGAYASDDSSGKKLEETERYAAQCHHHFERVTAAFRVLCDCESTLGSLSQEACSAAIGASTPSPKKQFKYDSPAKGEASTSAAAGTTLPSPKTQIKNRSPTKVHAAKSAVPTPSPQKKVKSESPAKVPRVAFQAPSSPAADAPEEQPEAAFPSLSQNSAKSVETIVLSSDTDDDDIVRVRRQRRPRHLS